jgi:hypothetical protein
MTSGGGAGDAAAGPGKAPCRSAGPAAVGFLNAIGVHLLAGLFAYSDIVSLANAGTLVAPRSAW